MAMDLGYQMTFRQSNAASPGQRLPTHPGSGEVGEQIRREERSCTSPSLHSGREIPLENSSVGSHPGAPCRCRAQCECSSVRDRPNREKPQGRRPGRSRNYPGPSSTRMKGLTFESIRTAVGDYLKDDEIKARSSAVTSCSRTSTG